MARAFIQTGYGPMAVTAADRFSLEMIIRDGYWGDVDKKTGKCVPQRHGHYKNPYFYTQLPEPQYCHTDAQFITRFKLLCMFFDELKDGENYDFGNGYTSTVLRYMGYSHCRCCPNTKNGDGEYLIHNHATNTTLAFPQGFIHYITEHNVHPNEKTVCFIMKMPVKIFIMIITKLNLTCVPKVKIVKNDVPKEKTVFSFKDAILKKQESNIQVQKQVVVASENKQQKQVVVPTIMFDFNDGLCEMIN